MASPQSVVPGTEETMQMCDDSNSDTESVCSSISVASSTDSHSNSKIKVHIDLPITTNKSILSKHFSQCGFDADVITIVRIQCYVDEKSKKERQYAIATLVSSQKAQEFTQVMCYAPHSLLFGKHRLHVKPYQRKKKTKMKQVTSPKNPQHKTGFPASSTPANKPVVLSVGPNLPRYVNEKHLRKRFKEFEDNIVEVRVDKGMGVTIGFVTVSSSAIATLAISNLNGKFFHQRTRMEVKEHVCVKKKRNRKHSAEKTKSKASSTEQQKVFSFGLQEINYEEVDKPGLNAAQGFSFDNPTLQRKPIGSGIALNPRDQPDQPEMDMTCSTSPSMAHGLDLDNSTSHQSSASNRKTEIDLDELLLVPHDLSDQVATTCSTSSFAQDLNFNLDNASPQSKKRPDLDTVLEPRHHCTSSPKEQVQYVQQIDEPFVLPEQSNSSNLNATIVSNPQCQVASQDAQHTSEHNVVQKVSRKVKSVEVLKPTIVKFHFNYSTNVSKFRVYVNQVFKEDVRYKILRIVNGDSFSEFEVEFESLSKGKRVIKILRKHDPSIEAMILKPKSPLDNVKKTVTQFQNNIESKKKQFLAKHKERLDELRQKHQDLEVKLKKKCSLELHQKLTEERKTLNHKIVEGVKQQNEFECYCEELLKKLKQLDFSDSTEKEALEAKVSQMRKDFGAECNHFSKPLPIYAYRKDIVEIVQEHQVSILIGETGSGKSTQIVQYLHGAGFSERGAIVCTQPRKVAAISLADHVSREMGEIVGRVLGYKAGIRGKYCDKTKIFYMTDHTLLNECIADRKFTKYSCLVIDEAHERSLNTDILLAFIKQSLQHRSDLRVVITSATIDPALFNEYFGGSCPVIKVHGRTFPVDVIWNPLKTTGSPISRQYVLDAVNLACKLHNAEQSGDILVFLTNPLEIEKACQETTREIGNRALVLPLHGKLQPEDQQKVFDVSPQRKIIFATNVAETSVTIPGVKYVIDTGLAKELCFDPKKHMNSLEVRIISKSSAEQRKGRAGRTSAGKCYRLYSENDYRDMPNKMLPEILRVALASTALKLYEFGISDILSFNFVEQPDRTALETAIKNLKFLGAIQDNRLTDLGKKMAALPTDPHLSKILLDGIDEDVTVEAATAVAISILAGSVFFRAGNEELKNESDMKTITFCHPAGDQMTYLHTYHQWASQSKNNQNKWCAENFVNAKSMRLVKECVHELRDILTSRFQIHFPQNINQIDLEKAEGKIPKLYFNAFIRNLCVYLGHERVGYCNESLPNERFVIFPGSPLRQLNFVPPVVVYEKTLKTSQNFMLQVLPVKEEWIHEAVAARKLPCNPCESELFQHLKVSPLIVSNLGHHILSSLQRNRQDIVKELDSEEIEPILEFLRKEGMLKVFLQTCYHDTVSMLLGAHISSIRDEMEREIYECGITTKDDNVRVLLSCGGLIKRVIMPHEYRTVVVKGPPTNQWQDKIYQQLQQYGITENRQSNSIKNHCLLIVTFRDPEDAMKAVTSLELPEVFVIKPQQFKQFGDAQVTFSLQIEWCRRKREDCAFIEFRNEEEFVSACVRLRTCYTVLGTIAKFHPSKDGSSTLFMANGARYLTEEQIKEAVLCALPELEESSIDVKLGFQKGFPTTQEQIAEIKEKLDSHIARYASKGKYNLTIDHPKNSHVYYKARVLFHNPLEGQQVVKEFRSVRMHGKTLTLKPSLSSIVRYSPEVYKVITESVEDIAQEIQKRFGSIKILHGDRDKKGKVLIKISSNNIKEFNIAKHVLHTVINPEVIECRNPILREYIYTTNCRESLRRIENETNTFIRVDRRTVSIKMYGTQANLTRAQIEFNKSLSFLDDGTKCHEIHLKKPGMPPGLMKHIITIFGHRLQHLEEREGIYSTRLNLQKQILTIFATESAYKSIMELVEEFSQSVNPHLQTAQHNPDEIDCCVCFTPISNESDIVRLESCGHSYCRECIEIQVAPSNVVLPISCAADDCSKPFVLKDFQNLSQRIGFNLQRLVRASIRSYMAANQHKVRPCPTPDCDMVYNVTEDSECFYCSHCNDMTCTACHEPYHDGQSCDMYKSEIQANEGVDRWVQADPENRKRCPKCRMPIEKIYGCNHIHCTSCSAHVCWFCLAYFDTSRECYTHMCATHGNIGLQPF